MFQSSIFLCARLAIAIGYVSTRKVSREDIINNVLQYKNHIIVGEKIISKCDTVWCEIAAALQKSITPLSIYTIVSCNRYGIRDKLSDCVEEKNVITNLSINSNSTINESFPNRSSTESKNTVLHLL